MMKMICISIHRTFTDSILVQNTLDVSAIKNVANNINGVMFKVEVGKVAVSINNKECSNNIIA